MYLLNLLIPLLVYLGLYVEVEMENPMYDMVLALLGLLLCFLLTQVLLDFVGGNRQAHCLLFGLVLWQEGKLEDIG